MMWIPFIVVAGVIVVIYFSRRVPIWVLLYKIQKESQKREAKEEAKRKENYERYQELLAEKQKKVDYMKSIGLEEVYGVSNDLWILRKDGKIKELVDLDGNRRPLAELARSSGTQIVGIDPVLYYHGERIDKWKMLNDEAEIRKLNNA
jgi:hypothetical protein